MAVQHMVWIRFKEDVTQAAIDAHCQRLRAMPEDIPVITGLSVGPTFTDRAQGQFTHALWVEVATQEDLPRYLDHPVHVEVASKLKADSAQVMAMDIDDANHATK